MFDISRAENKREVSFLLDGWKSYLTIIYGYWQVSNETFLLWNVKGTEHTFSIELSIVTMHHNSNYTDHFKLTLKKFREDLIIWYQQGLPEDYMKKYYNQFWHLIVC